MTLVTLMIRNAGRNRARALMTVGAVALTLVAFIILRTAVAAYNVFAENGAGDRLVILHRVAGELDFPLHYSRLVAEVPGVVAVHYGSAVEARNTKYPADPLVAIAGSPATFFEVFDEVVLAADERDRWIANRSGAMVGDLLAEEQHIAIGDALTLSSPDGTLSLQVEGIYRVARPGVPRNWVLFHYDLLNLARPPSARDRIMRIDARVDDAEHTDEVVKEVARILDGQEVPTLTESDLALRRAFLGSFSAILAAVDVGSMAILAIMLLIVANTIAMGARERTPEYAVMRALGFGRGHVMLAVLGEGLGLGALGGAVAILLAQPVVNVWLGGWLRQNAADLVPYWHADPVMMATTVAVACAAASMASIIPAWQASSGRVQEVLRYLG